MRIPNYVTFEVNPMVPSKNKSKWAPESSRQKAYVKYKNRLASIAKAKHFKIGNAIKVVFIIPISPTLTPKDQIEFIGQPHLTGKHSLPKLVEGIKEALIPEGSDLYRVDCAKYWGEKGKILIKNIVLEDFEYLRQIK